MQKSAAISFCNVTKKFANWHPPAASLLLPSTVSILAQPQWMRGETPGTFKGMR
jgi:hypothetical protein